MIGASYLERALRPFAIGACWGCWGFGASPAEEAPICPMILSVASFPAFGKVEEFCQLPLFFGNLAKYGSLFSWLQERVRVVDDVRSHQLEPPSKAACVYRHGGLPSIQASSSSSGRTGGEFKERGVCRRLQKARKGAVQDDMSGIK